MSAPVRPSRSAASSKAWIPRSPQSRSLRSSPLRPARPADDEYVASDEDYVGPDDEPVAANNDYVDLRARRARSSQIGVIVVWRYEFVVSGYGFVVAAPHRCAFICRLQENPEKPALNARATSPPAGSGVQIRSVNSDWLQPEPECMIQSDGHRGISHSHAVCRKSPATGPFMRAQLAVGVGVAAYPARMRPAPRREAKELRRGAG